MSNTVELKTYEEVLELIDGKENHLLLGNGFNYTLNAETGYEEIFETMMNDNSEYLELKQHLDNNGYDLENLIGVLKEKIRLEEKFPEGKIFLTKFIHNKVKLDFMKATSKIAEAKVKKLYKEENAGMNCFLENFTNYFTLNYDPFLYLLLMKFKDNTIKKDKIIALQQTHLFKKQDVDDANNDIYSIIKKARETGTLEVHTSIIDTNKNLKECKKTDFEMAISLAFKEEKGWTKEEIKETILLVLEDENDDSAGIIDDGFRQGSLFGESEINEVVYNPNIETQNVFFLHGAFHIYEDNKITKKITQTSHKALYQRLEEIISNEEKKILCIFDNANKEKEIMTSEYLQQAHAKVGDLSGSLIIIGSSLDKNDNHVFQQINNSLIETLYISTREKSKNKNFDRAKQVFPNKKIIMFDSEQITYKKTSNN